MKVFLSLLIAISSFSTLGQEKVNWSFIYNPVDHQILIKADIEAGWHLYSQYVDDAIGPVPTSFEFREDPNVVFVGQVDEPESIKEYDPNFEGELNFFKDEVVFIQNVEVKSPSTVLGTVTFMVCNDTMCLPPVDEIFKIEIQ